MRLYVICGHGAGDPGAGGNGYTEAERVRALGRRIAELGGDDVVLLDTDRNWYADAGIDSLDVPPDAGLVELHMDSGPAGARGGHVIIKAGYEADQYDRALADAMARIFPGRANVIVGRSDLANVNRAARRGINYRLVENGFISDAGDVERFNSRMDEVARAYLDAFGIPAAGPAPEPPKPKPTPVPKPGIDEVINMSARQGEVHRLNNPFNGDHVYTTDPGEVSALVKAGYTDEGVVGTAPRGLVDVHRLYNADTGEHLLTDDPSEATSLLAQGQNLSDGTKSGWQYEGVAFVAHADDKGPVKLHRLYRPDGFHLLTADGGEVASLTAKGWVDEGVRFSLD